MFEEKMKALAQRAPVVLPHLETEEATKNALIMPFIAALGYDVFDPLEVVPEFTADVGIKKGEKVDYAIKRDGDIIIIIEAKKAGAELNTSHSNQLFRYFTVTKARIAILTNGLRYQFFSDLDETNKMDEKPFLELNLLDFRENTVTEIKRLTKAAFDLDNMLTAASDLKNMREIRRVLERQLNEPDEDFVRLFFNRCNPNKKFVQSIKDQFARLVRTTMKQLIDDAVEDWYRAARERGTNEVEGKSTNAGSKEEDTDSTDGVITTEEELEGYNIVKAIVCKVIEPERVAYRDTKSYFNVLVDDNARKPICRLYLNRTKKYLGLFDSDKRETKTAIDSVNDLYSYADQLRQTTAGYLEVAKKPADEATDEAGRKQNSATTPPQNGS